MVSIKGIGDYLRRSPVASSIIGIFAVGTLCSHFGCANHNNHSSQLNDADRIEASYRKQQAWAYSLDRHLEAENYFTIARSYEDSLYGESNLRAAMALADSAIKYYDLAARTDSMFITGPGAVDSTRAVDKVEAIKRYKESLEKN